MLLDGARQVMNGKRPSLQDLLLTPVNALKIANQLAHLRGAAMKVGQLLSMDAGEVLPRELTDILARLRSDAHHMPQGQLRATLERQWGRNWQQRFETFSFEPIAAASIGQVHRARTKDGRQLAIKIQYPGVRQSIDSDIDNVATLLRLSGLLPATMDVAPMLREAKRQLHEEADYEREFGSLKRFGDLFAGSPDYLVPAPHADFSSRNVLAMTYVEGANLETLASAPQADRDRIAGLLINLVLRELFDFGLMQTDPNFANYRYNRATSQIVLLDFGAVRAFPPELVGGYRMLLKAGMAGDHDAAMRAMIDLGLLGAQVPRVHKDTVMRLFDLAMQPLRYDGAFDFGASDLVTRLRDGGMTIAAERNNWHVPPMDTLLLQRKIGGTFLLATKLKARVPLKQIVEKYLPAPEPERR